MVIFLPLVNIVTPNLLYYLLCKLKSRPAAIKTAIRGLTNKNGCATLSVVPIPNLLFSEARFNPPGFSILFQAFSSIEKKRFFCQAGNLTN